MMIMWCATVIRMMKMMVTMLTNDDDDSVVCDDDNDDYGDDGNDAHHRPPPCVHRLVERRDIAAPRPGGRGAAVGSQKGAAMGGGDG